MVERVINYSGVTGVSLPTVCKALGYPEDFFDKNRIWFPDIKELNILACLFGTLPHALLSPDFTPRHPMFNNDTAVRYFVTVVRRSMHKQGIKESVVIQRIGKRTSFLNDVLEGKEVLTQKEVKGILNRLYLTMEEVEVPSSQMVDLVKRQGRVELSTAYEKADVKTQTEICKLLGIPWSMV